MRVVATQFMIWLEYFIIAFSTCITKQLCMYVLLYFESRGDGGDKVHYYQTLTVTQIFFHMQHLLQNLLQGFRLHLNAEESALA